MTQRLNYIVYAPNYDENSGGSIFLHQLGQALHDMGEDVVLWPWNERPLTPGQKRIEMLRKPKRLFTPNWFHRRYKLPEHINTPIARHADLRPDSIVIYPEVTLGNPLGAKNIVRWLLYKPGIKDPYEFTENEMFFIAGDMSDLPELTGGAPELYLWRRNRVYRNEQRLDRSGACYMVRKGVDKPRIPETENATCIDGLGHAEVADIFNRSEVFYSYDEATMYSQFAAICGCLSVIVPGFYSNRAEWAAAHPIGRYGVAYGLDDVEHARQTQAKVLPMLEEKERDGLRTVEAFVKRTQAAFGQG